MRYLIVFLPFLAAAELRLPRVLSDGLVLQRDKPVRIWGWAAPETTIRVHIGDSSGQGRADGVGSWEIMLPAMPASAEARELRVSDGTSEVVVADVLVGEVWICGGQSNMEWTLRSSRNADMELAAADYPQIRYFRLPKIAHVEPQADTPEGEWRKCTRGSADHCTAVGYYFARRLHRVLKVPVGLIDNSWGGTMAQHWCSKVSLEDISELSGYHAKFAEKLKAWEDGGGEEGAQKRLAADTAKWEEERAKAKAAGEREPRRPNGNAYKNPAHQGQPGGMFNGSLMPIAKSTVRGALFYQGENNSFGVSWKPFYRTYEQVIADWRGAMGERELPFGLIQIAGWSNRRSMSYDMNHHCNVVREVQFDTWQRTPHTGLIVTYDTNSNGSIHPGRKQPVGDRTARWALAEVYGQKQAGSNNALEWKGPIFESAEFADGKVIVRFEAGTDRGLRLDQDGELGFVVAGEDREFHHARARIGTDKEKRQILTIWADEVPEPVAVRYAFSNLPVGGLMNARELPAYPFRSDNWEMTPHQSDGSYLRKKKGRIFRNFFQD